MIFIKKGIQCRLLWEGKSLEYVVVEMWTAAGAVKIINFYNPCKKLSINTLGGNTKVFRWQGDMVCGF